MPQEEKLPAVASMERLQSAAKELHDIKSIAELAEVLGESAQTVGNWAHRGVSRAGALKAESRLGLSARWIVDGTGKRANTEQGSDADAIGLNSPDSVVRRLRALLLKMPRGSRDLLGRQLQALAHAPDSPMLVEELRETLAQGLQEGAPQTQ